MKPTKLLTIITLVLIVLFSGCKKDTYVENPGLCPLVVSTDPVNLAIGVPLNKVITATFNENMNPLTVTAASFTMATGAKAMASVAGVVTSNGAVVTFTPSASLLANTTYTGTLKNTIKDTKGNSLQNDYVWTFSTGSVPSVTLADPLNLSTNVSLNKVVRATFSEVMDPLTITSTTFTLLNGVTPVAGTVSYTGSVASFTPTANLLPGTVYTATVTTGARNVSGIPMATNFVWTFNTGAVPAVTLTSPLNNATGVQLNKVVTAAFSEAMDPLTITGTTVTLMQGVTPVAGAVTYTGTTASFTPTVNLLPGTLYTATITTGARNAAGIPIAGNFVWSFTTATVPTVTLADPVNLATNVALNKVVSATFSEAMNPLTVTGTSFTLMNGVTPVAGAVTYAGSIASFTPTANLLAGITYTATITTAVTSVPGVPMSSNFVWTFTTIAVPPTVTSTIPVDLAPNVALNSNVSAIFSVPMDGTTLTGTTFTLMEGLNPVAGAVTYAGSTATFNPTVDLLSGTVYTATITTGAENVAGTPLAANYVWTFTTAIVAPTVTGVSPLNGATGVPQTSLVTATFSVPMDPLTITNSTFTLLQGLTPVAGAVTYTGTTATFTPAAILMSGSTFTATITTGAESVPGTPLASNYVWTFSTSAKGPGIVNLGTAGDFVAIGKTGISTTGTTAITGDIGVSPGAASLITGFGLVMDVSGTFSTTVPTTLVTGRVYASDYTPPTPAKMTLAVSDMENALTTAMGLTTSVIVDLGAGNISGMTLAPGLYKYNTGLLITASGVTLEGGPEDTWVFQISSDLTVNNGAMITLAGGAQAKNIFWVTNTQAILGTTVNFKGNILAQTLISLDTGATVLGRLLSQTAVTLNAATVVKP